MRKISLSDRLRYGFDNTMARGPAALIGWLFVLSLLLILATAAVVFLTGIGVREDGSQPDFGGLLWGSLMRAMDAGAVGADTGGWRYLLMMLVVTIGGIFIVSTLIGVLTSGIESRLETLRKGRSFVVEQGHTVILGWSSQIFAVIGELIAANANKRGACIAVLADKDKVEMEDEIRAKLGDTRGTRIVCRSGTPVDLADLEIINPHAARSIIILAPEGENPDSYVIKSMLALTNNPQRRKEPYHIVTEIRDPKNLEVARMVGRQEAELVLVGDLIARITVQTCRQSGLSVVYNELLNFEGDEIYFHAEPALVGKPFKEALLAYDQSAVLGLRLADGTATLNPPMDRVIAAGDKLIVVSADDDTIRLAAAPAAGAEAIRGGAADAAQPEQTLVLGWNQRAPSIIRELDHYVAPGSTTLVVAEPPPARELRERLASGANHTVAFEEGDTADRATLDELDMRRFRHVIVLSASDELETQEADSRTLITLLHLRDIGEKLKLDFTIVSEMLDERNRQLAEVTQADDFIVSNQLVGLMLSQIAENKELTAVFNDLFNADGAEIYLKPAAAYVEPGKPVNFATVVEAAARQGAVAFGYRLAAQASDAAKAYGVRLNPVKSAPITFGPDDKIVVLAES